MMSSKRRITRLSIEGGRYRSSKFCDFQMIRMKLVLNHFGLRIKRLDLISIGFSENLVDALNLMPNLEKIYLLYVVDEGIYDNLVELNLHKLKELESMGCSEAVLKVFHFLPSGVLKKIKLHQFENSETVADGGIKLFENQSNIKDVHLDHRFHQLINFDRLKLRSLILSSKVKQDTIIQGQNELKELSLAGVNEGDLKLISSELIALEDLKVCPDEWLNAAEFNDFYKMKNLKKLEISWQTSDFTVDSIINDSLSVFHHSSLVDLKLYGFTRLSDSTLKSLGIHAPMIRSLHLHTKSPLNVINVVIQHFSNLETFEFDNRFDDGENLDFFSFQEGIVNETLKKITIKTRCSFTSLPILVGCCPKLEEVDTFVISDTTSLRALLKQRNTLKKIRLTMDSSESRKFQQMSFEFIRALKTYGKNLVHFQCVYEEFKDVIEFLKKKSVFGSQFSYIAVKESTDTCPQCASYTLMMTNEADEIKKLCSANVLLKLGVHACAY